MSNQTTLFIQTLDSLHYVPFPCTFKLVEGGNIPGSIVHHTVAGYHAYLLAISSFDLAEANQYTAMACFRTVKGGRRALEIIAGAAVQAISRATLIDLRELQDRADFTDGSEAPARERSIHIGDGPVGNSSSLPPAGVVQMTRPTDYQSAGVAAVTLRSLLRDPVPSRGSIFTAQPGSVLTAITPLPSDYQHDPIVTSDEVAEANDSPQESGYSSMVRFLAPLTSTDAEVYNSISATVLDALASVVDRMRRVLTGESVLHPGTIPVLDVIGNCLSMSRTGFVSLCSSHVCMEPLALDFLRILQSQLGIATVTTSTMIPVRNAFAVALAQEMSYRRSSERRRLAAISGIDTEENRDPDRL